MFFYFELLFKLAPFTFSHLRCISAEFTRMKNSVASKQKTYRCVVWLSKPISAAAIDMINNIERLEILQQTPLRVLHRSALSMPPRDIISSTSFIIIIVVW